MDQRLPTIDEYLASRVAGTDPADGPHLISVDQLRAAGALDVPPEWRKSLGGEAKGAGANGQNAMPLFAAVWGDASNSSEAERSTP